MGPIARSTFASLTLSRSSRLDQGRFPAMADAGAGTGAKELDGGGQDRDPDDGDDHELEIPLDHRLTAEPPAAEQECEDPGHAADNVVGRKPGIVHPPDAGHEGREGPDEWDEPG